MKNKKYIKKSKEILTIMLFTIGVSKIFHWDEFMDLERNYPGTIHLDRQCQQFLLMTQPVWVDTY
jgi:hypothetical protein